MTKADGIPVYCAHSEIVPIDMLRPNPRNPNTHPPKQLALLAKIIREQGWRNPICVSNRSGMIVKGHARLAAAKLIPVNAVPIDRQDYASDEQEWADMVADNRLAELAEIDQAILKDIMAELDTGGFDMELTGFYLPEIEELMTQFHVGGDEPPAAAKNAGDMITCPQCGHEWEA